MNRSIEVRLKKLESLAAPEMPLRRSHLFAAQTDQERDAAIAALVASGADPDDFFIQLVGAPFPPDHPSFQGGQVTEG